MTRVSIIIVSYNTRDTLERCLESIETVLGGGADDDPALPMETVVVDNASTDGSPEMVRERFPGVRLKAWNRNMGFAGGCNSGAAGASGDLLLFLNSDCRVTPGAVEKLARFLDENEAAAVAGRLVGEDGETQEGFNVRRLPTARTLLADLLLLHRWLPGNRLSSGYRMAGFDPDAPSMVEQPAGACLMIRASVFESVGGFDEDYHPAWFEDVDLCRRLKDEGEPVFYVPGAVFEHVGGATMSRLSFREFTRVYYRNQRVYVRKHFALPARWLISAATLLGMTLRFSAVLLLPVHFSGPVGRAGRVEAADAFASVIVDRVFPWLNR